AAHPQRSCRAARPGGPPDADAGRVSGSPECGARRASRADLRPRRTPAAPDRGPPGPAKGARRRVSPRLGNAVGALRERTARTGARLVSGGRARAGTRRSPRTCPVGRAERSDDGDGANGTAMRPATEATRRENDAPTAGPAAWLPYHRPSIGEEEIAEVIDTLRSGWVTTGAKARRFEQQFAALLGVSHALAVSSSPPA